MLALHGVLILAPCLLFTSDALMRPDGFGFCVFKRFFGIECPACGITHAVRAMLAGNFAASFDIHPAGPLITILLLLLFSYFMLVTLFGNRITIAWAKEVRNYNRIEMLALIALGVGWLYKLVVK